jgi:hypothetical protein
MDGGRRLVCLKSNRLIKEGYETTITFPKKKKSVEIGDRSILQKKEEPRDEEFGFGY